MLEPTLESDVYGRQILTSKVDPRAVRVELHVMLETTSLNTSCNGICYRLWYRGHYLKLLKVITVK